MNRENKCMILLRVMFFSLSMMLVLPAISDGSENKAPVVNAGSDRSMMWPENETILSGSVIDDGMPDHILDITWRLIDGPGSVQIDYPHQLKTTARFGQPGIYRIQLEADDGELFSTNTFTIHINSAKGETMTLSPLNKKDDAEETWAGRVKLRSKDLDLTQVGTGRQVVGIRFSNLQLLRNTKILEAYLEFKASEISIDQTDLTISVEDTNDAAPFKKRKRNLRDRELIEDIVHWIDVAPWDEVGRRYRTPDLSVLVQKILNRWDWEPKNSIAFLIRGTGHRSAYSMDGKKRRAPHLVIRYETNQSENQPPVAEAGIPETLIGPNTQSDLLGRVIDDGLGSNTLSTRWELLEGPLSLQIDNPSDLNTSIRFFETGTYVLSLTAHDGEFSHSDTVTFNVIDSPMEKKAPVVKAGIDQEVLWPEASIFLKGGITDIESSQSLDLFIEWSKEAGPGEVTFDDPNSVDTNAHFSETGKYILKLTVDDGASLVVDRLVVMVNEKNGNAFYVDPESSVASDGNPGSEKRPWQSLRHAMAVAEKGDIVRIRGGVYKAQGTNVKMNPAFAPSQSGTADAPIVFEAYPIGAEVRLMLSSGAGPILGSYKKDHIHFKGFTLIEGESYLKGSALAIYWEADHGRFERCTFIGRNRSNNPYNHSGIRLEKTEKTVVSSAVFNGFKDNMKRRHTGNCGITLSHASDAVIEHCSFAENTCSIRDIRNGQRNVFRFNFLRGDDTGLLIRSRKTDPSSESRIYQNIFTHVGAYGGSIHLGKYVKELYIFNNTFYNSRSSQDTFSGVVGSRGKGKASIFIANNVISKTERIFHFKNIIRQIKDSDFNLYFMSENFMNNGKKIGQGDLASWQKVAGFDRHSLSENPLFVNAGGNTPDDYRLNSNSPCLNAGESGETLGAYIRGDEIIGPFH